VAAAEKKQKLMWEALREAVDEEMEADPTVCLMGAPLRAAARSFRRPSAAGSATYPGGGSVCPVTRVQVRSEGLRAMAQSGGRVRQCVAMTPHRRPGALVGLASTPVARPGIPAARRRAGEDVGHYGGSYKVSYDLHKKYGDLRLLDTPICGALPRPTLAARTAWRPCLARSLT